MVRLFAANALLALTLTSAASAQGLFQPGTQPTGHDGGLVEPLLSSRQCRSCHGNYGDDGDYEPYDTWRGSLMASGLRDPVVRAALSIAEADAPEAADFCVRCHSPSAWLRGRSELPDFSSSNPGTPERAAPDHPTDQGGLSNDLDGVGCMVCHRMVRPEFETQLANAQLVLADGDNASARRGPYTYAENEDPRHGTAFEPFLSESGFCGSCHDIHNPLHQGFRGTVATGRPFAMERTFSEWRESAFADRGQTCQDCHLPEVDAPAAAEGIGSRPRMSRHDLAGGNVWVPRALAADVRAFDPRAADALDASSRRAESMLESAARLEISNATLEGQTAQATVRVTNLSGHKLPTGYPEGRRMWLELEVSDASGAVVARSGHYDQASATLERDPQLRTYEVKLGVGQSESFHFVLNDTLLEDTRIPPTGFRTPEGTDMEPLGRDYSDGAGGYRDYDEASYRFEALCGEGVLTLRARLRFQPTTREYIEFLRDHAPPSADPALNDQSWGQLAYEAWRSHGGDVPFDMEVTSRDLGRAPAACPPDAGVASIDASVSTDAASAPPPRARGCACRAGGSSSHPLLSLPFIAIVAARARGRRRSKR